METMIHIISGLFADHPILLGLIGGSAGLGTIATGVLSFLRRHKKSAPKNKIYFKYEKLLEVPTKRPAYSDRMAYVLAELSDLVYFEFEGSSGAVVDAAKRLKALDIADDAQIQKFLESYTLELMGSRKLNIDFLTQVLKKSDFELLDTINVEQTQGIVCKYEGDKHPPYLVIAFRGTEKKISDWLTNAKAEPALVGEGRVHTGFYEAFTQKTDASGRTVYDIVETIMKSSKAKDSSGNPLPIYFAGHSLGGALALLATNLLARDVIGACYTFGGPRIGDYNFFKNLKTPVYRVVNSSDIVPRVPPGAIVAIVLFLIRYLASLTRFIPVLASILRTMEKFFDKLNGYRHVGDLRYLTDMKTGQFHTVRLLSNPPAIDRVMWMWQHIAASFFLPVSSHSMSIYREKLQFIASNRFIGK